MATITKEEYEFFKSQNPEDLTQEELNWINEYEKAEAGAPSAEDMEWATFILNERDPQIQAINRKNGDFDKAMKLINQNNAARQVMQQKGQDPYVKKVTSTPEDVVKDSGFNFNWRNAYENVKGEKLRATEADAKKLQDFINSNMYNVNDDVKMQQIAYNLHMYNPNTMKWTDFINSEQGEEFKKYLDDVRKSQTEKAVEDIWSGKEDKTFGDKTSSFLINFMLPVSKEYAKKHYNDEDFSMTGPLLTDTAANLVMMGPGAAETLPAKVSVPLSKVMNRPLVSALYGNVVAPAITETGNLIYNDESIPEVLARTAEGTAVNIVTPRILEDMLSWAGRGLPTIEGKRKVQKMIDEAANKAEEVNRKISKGVPYPRTKDNELPIEYAQQTPTGKKYFSTDPVESAKRNPNHEYNSVSEMPPEAISNADYIASLQGLPFSRSKANKDIKKYIKNAQDDKVNNADLLLQKAQSLAKDGDLRNLTPSQLRQLGFNDKESLINYLIRSFKTYIPSTLSSYMTNAAGRPEFGREAGPIENINRMFGTSFFVNKKPEDKQKSRIERLLGM